MARLKDDNITVLKYFVKWLEIKYLPSFEALHSIDSLLFTEANETTHKKKVST